MSADRTEYIREYNKTTYKTVKVYVPINEYDTIKKHAKKIGYESISGYIKALIDKDMQKENPSEEG